MITHVSLAQSLIHRRGLIIICGGSDIIIVLTYNVLSCLGAETALLSKSLRPEVLKENSIKHLLYARLSVI